MDVLYSADSMHHLMHVPVTGEDDNSKIPLKWKVRQETEYGDRLEAAKRRQD